MLNKIDIKNNKKIKKMNICLLCTQFRQNYILLEKIILFQPYRVPQAHLCVSYEKKKMLLNAIRVISSQTPCANSTENNVTEETIKCRQFWKKNVYECVYCIVWNIKNTSLWEIGIRNKIYKRIWQIKKKKPSSKNDINYARLNVTVICGLGNKRKMKTSSRGVFREV